MESIVFANSPLAEYLEGNGTDDCDWGIENPNSDSSDDDQPQFAPPLSSSVRSRFSARSLTPLKLSLAGTSPATGRKAKLYELLSRAVDSRLGRRENTRFLERFRYIIVASQLLNGHVNVSHYDGKPKADASRVRPFSEDEDDDVSIFGQQYATKPRIWIGSGGFVLVTSVVISWVFRGGSGFNKARAITVLVFTLVAAVVLFTHARRKWLRRLRARSIEYVSIFVENSQTLDILASNAVTLIQEVELVSRGYRLSAPLPPITRLERDSQTRRCARLRKSVLETLSRAIPPHNHACEVLRDIVEEENLERYFDVYDIQLADLEDAEVGFEEGEYEDMQSLKVLKALLHRLHTIRRVFLCSLMAIEADGRHADIAKWGLVVDQLKSVGNLIAQLAGDLKKVSTEEENFSVPPTPSKLPQSPESEKFRGQLRKFNSLSQALRGLQAKMHVLREESDKTLQESDPDLNDFGRDLLTQYDSIGADLRGLVDEWENARASLMTTVDRRAGSSSPNSTRYPESIDGTTLCGNTPRNSGLFTKEDGSWAEAGLYSPTKETQAETDSDVEEVFEGIAEPRPKSTLTRDERIRKVQEERVLAAERRKKTEAGLALQKELQTVLLSRPPKRRSMQVQQQAIN